MILQSCGTGKARSNTRRQRWAGLCRSNRPVMTVEGMKAMSRTGILPAAVSAARTGSSVRSEHGDSVNEAEQSGDGKSRKGQLDGHPVSAGSNPALSTGWRPTAGVRKAPLNKIRRKAPAHAAAGRVAGVTRPAFPAVQELRKRSDNQ